MLALVVVTAASNTAQAKERWSGWSQYETQYLNAYAAAYKAGHDVGRNLVDDDLSSGEKPSQGRVEASTARMDAWLHPVPAPEPVAEVATTTAATTYSSGSTSWDAVAACESSGNWSTSTGNGYYGGLQFDSGTWDAYGDPSCSEASDCSRESQIAAAESMPYDGWPNC